MPLTAVPTHNSAQVALPRIDSFDVRCRKHVTAVATVTDGQNIAPGSHTRIFR